MAEHALGHMTWSRQREIIRSVQNNPRTAVRACHSSSKTFTAAEIAVIFYNLHPAGLVITTAPIFMQVEMLLWSEINKIYINSNIVLMGKCLQTEIKDPLSEERHFALGFSTDKPKKAEGWHAWDILFIFDEAKGVESWMWDSAQGAMTGGNSKWLVISTTDGVEVGSKFFNCFQPGSKWNQIHISAYDSPMATGEQFEKLVFPEPGNITKFHREYVNPKDAKIQLATQEWIDDRADTNNPDGWGKDSVLFKTKVEGKLCDMGSNAIIKLSQVKRMWANQDDSNFDCTGKRRAGIDVAWGGENATVCWKAKGQKVLALPLVIETPDLPPKDIVSYQGTRIAEYLQTGPYEEGYEIKIDVASGGIGLASWLQGKGFNVVCVNNAAVSDMPDMYDDMASQMWFEGAKIIQDIACPKVPRLERELVQRMQVPLTRKGKQKVEPKKEYIKRGFKSPDYGDAFLLVWHEQIGKGGYVGESNADYY